jgi:enoyl-CoA hydratase/carnithine racemase
MTMSQPLVHCERIDRVAVLTLCDPARRNVLSRAMLTELRDRISELSRDPQIKCVILAAQGPAFSAGHDLREVLAASPEELESLFALCSAAMESIRKAPQPVIAQVQGIATAAGCQLAATCDLVAAEDAHFALRRRLTVLPTPAVAIAAGRGIKRWRYCQWSAHTSASPADRPGEPRRAA